jgi:hypothetical protein
MAQLALGVVGGVAGYFVSGGNPYGAYVGFTLGAGVGAYVDQPKTEGPRLLDKKVADFTYGAAIPHAYGTIRIAGFPIYMSDLDEHAREESGKGGGGYTSFTYTCDLAVGVCEGPIGAILRIWANGILIYDAEDGEAVAEEDREAIPEGGLAIYKGTEEQLPDATLEARLPPGYVPGYRGTAYIVVEGFRLEKFGNRMPSFEFEVTPGDVTINDETTREEIAKYSNAVQGFGEYMVRSDAGYFLVADPTDSRSLLIVEEDVGAVGSMDFSQGVSGDRLIKGEGVYSRFTYVAYHNIRFAKIDMAAFPTGSYSDHATAYLPTDITFYSGHVYTVNLYNHRIAKYTGDGVLVGTVYQPIQLGGDTDQPAADYICFDRDGNIWGIPFSDNAGTSQLVRISALGTPTLYDLSPYAVQYAIDYDPDRHSLVMIDGHINQLIEWDIASGTVVQTFPVKPGTNHPKVAYEPVRKEWYTWDKTVANEAKILAINLATGNVRTFHVERDTGYTVLDSGTLIPNGDGSVYAADRVGKIGSIDAAQGSHIGLYRSGFEMPADREGVLLSEVVTDLCLASGLETGDIDVTELTDIVDGFMRARPMAARACIEALVKAYAFDMVESDWTLKFPKRARSAVATIDEYFFVDDGKEGGTVEVMRGAELELPKEIRIKYMDFALDYDPNVQYARREVVDADGVIENEIPVVITADEARNAAQSMLLFAWMVRDSFRFSTSMKYATIDATDVVSLPFDDYYRAVRILRQAIGQGVVEFEATFDISAIYDPGMTGVAGSTLPGGTVVIIGDAIAYLLDIPLLRDSDDGLVFYWASAREVSVNAWRGALLFKSTDGGGSYAELDAAPTESAIGTATALGDWTGGNVRDTENTLDVALTSGASLSSASYVGMLNGANTAIVGSEIIQFQNAEDLGSNVWRLSTLLRGRRGTEWAIADHAAGERFILLSVGATRVVNGEASEINLPRQYKALMSGRAIADADVENFTLTGASLKPYAPVHLAAVWGSDIDLSWVRRTRVGGAWADGIDVPLSEASESFEIEIYDAAFGSLKRTLISAVESATYSAAQIVTDFGAPPAQIGVRVYQISAAIGRGYAGEAVL